MLVVLTIKVNNQKIEACFDSNLDAIEVYNKMFDALLCGDNPNGFEMSLEVSK